MHIAQSGVVQGYAMWTYIITRGAVHRVLDRNDHRWLYQCAIPNLVKANSPELVRDYPPGSDQYWKMLRFVTDLWPIEFSNNDAKCKLQCNDLHWSCGSK